MLLVFLALLFPADLSAQDHADSFLTILSRYESGDIQGAADAAMRMDVATSRALARLVFDDVDRSIVKVRRMKVMTKGDAPVRSLMNEIRRERIRLMRLTLLVHTEAALRVNDVKALGDQITLARTAAGRLRRIEDDWKTLDPEGLAGPWPDGQLDAMRSLVREWYLVVASRLQSDGALAVLKTHVREGLEFLRDDPELLLARGSISEGEADSAVVDRSLVGEIYASSYALQWRQYMSAAGGDYQAAMRRQPDLHEATLRWGRICTYLGDRKEARRALDRVAASDAPANLRYLAHLFLGDLAEREQQPDRARAAYESALALVPTAQAPMMALSLLCDSVADNDCARRWLSQSMAATGRGRLEPWWAYQRGQAWLGERRLAAFREKGLQR